MVAGRRSYGKCRFMSTRHLLVPLLLAGFTSVAFAQTNCIITDPDVTYRVPPLTYPMTSDRYAVQYKLGDADWTNATVYISYYGGTDASPLHSVNVAGCTPETSMSFVSIPARASTRVQLRVTKLGSSFSRGDPVSVRPSAKPVDVHTASDGTAELSTLTAKDFAGDQFILWWGESTEGGSRAKTGIPALAFFLNPPYFPPTGTNVMTITAPTDLQNLSNVNTLVFQGTVALGGTGDVVYVVPSNITTIFLAPDAWVQGKLRFDLGRRRAEARLRSGCAGWEPVSVRSAGLRRRPGLRRPFVDEPPDREIGSRHIPPGWNCDHRPQSRHGRSDRQWRREQREDHRLERREWRIQARRQHECVQRICSQRRRFPDDVGIQRHRHERHRLAELQRRRRESGLDRQIAGRRLPDRRALCCEDGLARTPPPIPVSNNLH